MKEINIKPPFIKLEQFIKFIGESETGGHAKLLIQNGEISVNGEICEARGKKLFNNDIVKINGTENCFKVIIN